MICKKPSLNKHEREFSRPPKRPDLFDRRKVIHRPSRYIISRSYAHLQHIYIYISVGVRTCMRKIVINRFRAASMTVQND